MSPILIARVMRHLSWDTTRKHYVPGDMQTDAAKLRKPLVSIPTGVNADTAPSQPENTVTQKRRNLHPQPRECIEVQLARNKMIP